MSTDKQEKRVKVPSTKQARVDRIVEREAEQEIREALLEEESFDVPRIFPKRIVGKRIPVVSAEIEREEDN